MPFIRHVTTAVPEHRIDQAVARDFSSSYFASHRTDLRRLLPIFDHTGVESRYFSRPLSWFAEPRSFAEKNRVHLESTLELSTNACRSLFEATGLDPREIDGVVFVNSTGVANPTPDATLIHDLGLRSDVFRVPIWGLGCAGGVSGLAHACRLVGPSQRVLLIAVELCGLTFLSADYSKANLVACALFGEGAAVVLVEGDEVATTGARFERSSSTHYRDTLDVMGWHVVDEGLQVVFAQRIPQLVRENARGHFDELASLQGISFEQIDQFVFHPGGAKVLAAYEEALGLSASDLAGSREVLREFGNMSSVTALFVLERVFERANDPDVTTGEGLALLSALGPGFSAESVLLSVEIPH